MLEQVPGCMDQRGERPIRGFRQEASPCQRRELGSLFEVVHELIDIIRTCDMDPSVIAQVAPGAYRDHNRHHITRFTFDVIAAQVPGVGGCLIDVSLRGSAYSEPS